VLRFALAGGGFAARLLNAIDDEVDDNLRYRDYY
jgi:hypothetical protein